MIDIENAETWGPEQNKQVRPGKSIELSRDRGGGRGGGNTLLQNL
tara:strand:+ start:117 stop:251 length:135 start_codon:yes stop_codon:yes gene_type:complete